MSEEILAYLRKHNVPITAQWLAIAELILGSVRHLSADEVVRELKARKVKVGTATVYRSPRAARTERFRRARLRPRLQALRARPRHPHPEHPICSTCGAVRESRDERLERIITLMGRVAGYTRGLPPRVPGVSDTGWGGDTGVPLP